MSEADLKTLSQLLREECPGHYGWQTAETLVRLAKPSVSSRQALQARQSSMRILCDQLEHTRNNLKLLQQEIERLLDHDPKAKKVLSIPELGSMTVAVLREMERPDQIVARGAVVIFAASCIWRLCAAFAYPPLPLGSTIVVWWNVA